MAEEKEEEKEEGRKEEKEEGDVAVISMLAVCLSEYTRTGRRETSEGNWELN